MSVGNHDLLSRLDRIEALIRRNLVRQYYTVNEFAAMVKRAPYTVRQWCNESQINATKTQTRTGSCTRWAISHTEYERLQRDGLLPKQ